MNVPATIRCRTTILVMAYRVWQLLLLCGIALCVSGDAAYGQSSCDVSPSEAWKNSIDFPNDSFRAVEAGYSEGIANSWIKFAILQCNPTTVYFQNSQNYPFHYNFAQTHLDPFRGVSLAEFDEATLYAENRQAILGAVLWSRTFVDRKKYEYGVQFVGRDPFEADTIVALMNLVTSQVQTDSPAQAFYFPTYEQRANAEADRGYLATQGVVVSSPSRWIKSNVVYSQGWSVGTLKYFPADQIEQAYQSGQLAPLDILLTDEIPAEVPHVAGILSLAPSTPNAHVAILADANEIPFAHLAIAADAAQARALVGRRIGLTTVREVNQPDVQLIDLSQVEDGLWEEILALKELPALDFQPIEAYSGYGASATELTSTDIRYFGGKAANFGLLRRTIPEHSPIALALSFTLWQEFLEQPISSGRTLAEEIEGRLANQAYPPTDMAALSAHLAEIRELFKDVQITQFSEAQKRAIVELLQDPEYEFDSNRKLRFRSSTNVEDSESFTGAGLYDSYSGCLADDLDADDLGPSLCDDTKPAERGVFRAIRKVFASFYNDNAYLERLRRGVDEAEVGIDLIGMAILVHHSFPDEIELANGVGIYRSERHPAVLSYQKPPGTLVTQKGAVSVSNPADSALPEEVSVWNTDRITPTFSLRQQSTLTQLGQTVLTWQRDYAALLANMKAVANAFQKNTGKEQFALDFEYKKLAPEGTLMIKQVRELPVIENGSSITPFLLNEPLRYCLFERRLDYNPSGDGLFTHHRLKAEVVLETRNMRMSEANLQTSIFTSAAITYTVDGRLATLNGSFSTWPGVDYQFGPGTRGGTYDATASWRLAALSNPRTYRLHIPIQTFPVLAAQSPLLTLRDLDEWQHVVSLEAIYDEKPSYPTAEWTGSESHGILLAPYGGALHSGSEQPYTEQVDLRPCYQVHPNNQLQTRTLDFPNQGLQIETSFYWPPWPNYPTAGYTAPIAQWGKTTITGLTSQPIVLQNSFAQTYAATKHNFQEYFLFDPFLDPDVPLHLLDELSAKEIRLILAAHDFGYAEDSLIFYSEPLPAPLQWLLPFIAAD